MDKVKVALTQLKKYHFWVLSGVVVLLALMAWMQATADVDARFKKQQSELEGKFSSVREVSNTPNHPNEKVIGYIREQIDGGKDREGMKQKILQAWKILYTQQQKKNPLPTKVLGEKFQEDFEHLGPQGELPDDDRDAYMNHIGDHFKTLFNQIDLRHPKDEDSGAHKAGNNAGDDPRAGGGGRRAGREMPGAGQQGSKADEMVGIVEWDPADCERLQKRFFWTEIPSTQEVRLAQEDLWVYEALLRIISDTNAGTTYETAAIKRIEALEIGKQAVQSWKKEEEQVVRGLASGGGTSPAGAGGAVPAPRVPGGSPAMLTRDRRGGFGGLEESSPLADRYVDDKGKPLADETKHPYAEFKMMPINLRLVIEQTKIVKLLAHCANSNMPIDVRAVRFRPGEGEPLNLSAIAQAVALAKGGPAGSGGPAGMVVPAGRPARAMPNVAAGEHPRPTNQSSSEPVDSGYIPIEVRGIIYIYNPPDLSKLGTGGTGAGKAAPGAPAVAPPPTAPPPPATPATLPPTAPPGATPPALPAAMPGTPGSPMGSAPVRPGTPLSPPVPATGVKP